MTGLVGRGVCAARLNSRVLLCAGVAVYWAACCSLPVLAASVTINDSSSVTSYTCATPATPEVHVIGVYETSSDHSFGNHPTGYADVRVAYDGSGPMQPITLVLSSYEPNVWRFDIDPDAVVEKIVVSGYYTQSVTGADGIPVVTRSYEAEGETRLGPSAYRWPLSTGGSSTQGLLVAVEDLFDTRISSFTGAYRATSFTVEGTPAGAPVVNPRLGAGNLVDGPNPDLIYDCRTGDVQIDLADLAAQYPFGSGEIWWQYFDAQRLFIALANHDGSFSVDHLQRGRLGDLTAYPGGYFNENRIGYDSVSLCNWEGERLDLGAVFPTGFRDTAALRNYLAAAYFSTNREQGDFDLFVINVPEPSGLSLILPGLLLLLGASRRGAKWHQPQPI